MLFTDRFSISGLCVEVDYCVDLLLDEMQKILSYRCLCIFVTWHNLNIFLLNMFACIFVNCYDMMQYQKQFVFANIILNNIASLTYTFTKQACAQNTTNHLCPLLLTWFNFDPNMDKWIHPL